MSNPARTKLCLTILVLGQPRSPKRREHKSDDIVFDRFWIHFQGWRIPCNWANQDLRLFRSSCLVLVRLHFLRLPCLCAADLGKAMVSHALDDPFLKGLRLALNSSSSVRGLSKAWQKTNTYCCRETQVFRGNPKRISPGAASEAAGATECAHAFLCFSQSGCFASTRQLISRARSHWQCQGPRSDYFAMTI